MSQFDIRPIVAELRKRGAPQAVIDSVANNEGFEGVDDLGNRTLVCTDFSNPDGTSVVMFAVATGGPIRVTDTWVIE